MHQSYAEANGGLKAAITLQRGVNTLRTTDSVEEHPVLRERQRLAEELHSGPIAVIWYLGAKCQQAKERLTSGNLTEAMGMLQRLEELMEDYERSLLALASAERTDGGHDGLIPLVSQCLEELQRRSGVKTSLRVEGSLRYLSPAAGAKLAGILREALINTGKHARATAVELAVCEEPLGLRLLLVDDGVGCKDRPLNAECREQWGIKFMRGRIREMGGKLGLRSGRSGGFSIELFVPWQ